MTNTCYCNIIISIAATVTVMMSNSFTPVAVQYSVCVE